MIYVLLPIVLGLVPAVVAQAKGRSFVAWWLYGTLLWIVAMPHALLLSTDQGRIDARAVRQGGKKCPHCAEIIRHDARVCRFCGREQLDGEIAAVSKQSELVDGQCAGHEREDENKNAAWVDAYETKWRLPILGLMALLILSVMVLGGRTYPPTQTSAINSNKVSSAQSDTAANAPHGEIAPSKASSSKVIWRKVSDTSDMDGSKAVYLSTSAKEPVAVRGEQPERPSLYVRCLENKTSIFISFDAYLDMSEKSVRYRIDDLPPQTGSWLASTDNKAIGLWSGSSAIPFIRQILDHDRLLFRFTPFSSNSIEMTFDIRGLRAEAEELAAACGWKL